MNDRTVKQIHATVGALKNPRYIAPALVAVALSLSACKENGSATTAAAPPSVEVAKVLMKEVVQWDEFNGRVSAVESVELRARVTGHIVSTSFKEGGTVRKGDVLFQLDERPFRAVLDAATAQLERARALAQNAQLQDRRAQTLMEARAMSVEEQESRRANRAQSEADVRAAEAAVATARLNLEFATVRSPINGRASRAFLTSGNLVVADQSVLTSVVSQDPVYVYFDPDEHSYLSYRTGKGLGDRGSANFVAHVGLASETGFPHEGVVEFMDNQLDPATGTIRARAVVRNPDQALTPGLYARVRFAPGGAAMATLLDERAVLTDQDRKYVYVLSKDNKAVRRDVELGRTAEGLRIVKAGLEANDRVLVSGLQRVFFSGAPVSATEVPMTRQAATLAKHDAAAPATN
ncbi:efflux RND transporter periplasmic adaptor subunit [Cupriavidus pampae]|uniref:Efflux pump periplasmic linker BepF n=1 Tax=Cupriavidus pampae TaxID=659251 RepID=A0ABN7Y0A4_9BURK|nr:efflux RND transporter periplasmic adaptor subunit [Cupriavidus pampae]CAG9165866.1 Efflux pump periplasmic linker BepF [Cupriavidus pampae]